MKFLIAPDKFKDCLSADVVANCMMEGVLKVFPLADVKISPIADGGEGTAEIITQALGGEMVDIGVHDPLLRPVRSKLGLVRSRKLAVIEMATASGLELLKNEERNPLKTSTFGTGELIKAALDEGCKEIILGIGGSATNDAGVGALMALGVEFCNVSGNKLDNIGGNLSLIDSFNLSNLDKRLSNIKLTIACDVNNILTGPEGASSVFSLQKGADAEMAQALENHLKHFALIIRQQLNIEIENIPGSGAAGGLGAGLIAFADAQLLPGFEIISKALELDKLVQWADIVLTGEGKVDSMTGFGKAPAGLSKLALKYEKPIILIAGALGERYQELYKTGFSAVYSIAEGIISKEESILKAPELIRDRTKDVMQNLRNGNLNLSKQK